MVSFVFMEVSCLKGIGSSTRGRIVPLMDGSKVLCGRSETAYIRINSNMISRRHAELEQKDGAWTIKDLQSLNGVYVNGIRLKPLEQTGLSDGDRVQLGVASGPDEDAEFVWIYHRNFRIKRRKTAKDNEATSSCSGDTLSPVIAGKLTAGSDEASNPDSVSSLAFPLEAAPKAATKANSRIGNELQMLPSLSADRLETLEPVLASSTLSCSVVKMENTDCQANSKAKEVSGAVEKLKHEQLLQQREEHLVQMETELKEKEKRNKALEVELERKRRQLEIEIEMQQNLLKRDCEEADEEADEVQQKCSRSKRCRTEGEAAAAELLCATKDDVCASQLRRDIGEVMESELQCSICSELLIRAVSINCSHSFCSYCLEKWMAMKRQCPVCRAPVISTVPVIALDSYINRMVDENFSEDMKSRRQALIKERQAIQPLPAKAEFARPVNATHRTEEERSIPWLQPAWARWISHRRNGRPRPDFTEDRSQLRIWLVHKSTRRGNLLNRAIIISDNESDE